MSRDLRWYNFLDTRTQNTPYSNGNLKRTIVVYRLIPYSTHWPDYSPTYTGYLSDIKKRYKNLF